MKKLVFASVLTMASLAVAATPALFAQDSSDSITIKDQAEFNAYNNAITQTDPKAKAAAIEAFLTAYPQSVVKKTMLNALVEAYQSFDLAKTADAAGRLLQIDPNNLKAIFVSVYYKKLLIGQAEQQKDTAHQTQYLDEAAALAQKGLAAPMPPEYKGKEDDYKKLRDTTDPLFHSIIAADDAVSKKDFKAAIAEYRTELQAMPLDATKSGLGLSDTYKLGDAYTNLDPKDILNAVWFFARAADFAPAQFKPGIESNAKYYYNRYHGGTDGFDKIEALAATSLLPTADYTITPAPTPKDLAHQAVTGTADLSTLNLNDQEYILANGSTEDAEKVWAVVKDKTVLLPGDPVVIAATASQIQVAVTDDAKHDKKADFTVNMKEPLADKDIPAVGATINNLYGTYDSYTQTPPQIVLKDGGLQVEEKKKPVHKPSAAHKKAS